MAKNFNGSLIVFNTFASQMTVIGFDFEAYMTQAYCKKYNLPKVNWAGFIYKEPNCETEMEFYGQKLNHSFRLNSNDKTIIPIRIKPSDIEKLNSKVYVIHTADVTYLGIMQ